MVFGGPTTSFRARLDLQTIEIFYLSVNILQMPVGWYLSFNCQTKRDQFHDFAISLHIISEFQAKQKVTVNFLHYPGVYFTRKWWILVRNGRGPDIEYRTSILPESPRVRILRSWSAGWSSQWEQMLDGCEQKRTKVGRTFTNTLEWSPNIGGLRMLRASRRRGYCVCSLPPSAATKY